MIEYIVPVDENSLTQEELTWFENHGAKRLVRCKDCVHYYNKDDKGMDFPDSCDLRDWFVSPDWFCADGRKKDGVDN